MDVVKYITKDRRPVTLVATGDGTTEFPKLEAFSKRYNGKKVLWFPEKPKYSPFRRRSHFQNQRIGGLDVLEVLTVYPGLWKLHRYLFIIDREHFGGEPTNDICERLKGLGIAIEYIKQLNGGAFHIFCNYGSHKLGVYIAISGKERRIEEDVATLIKLEFNTDVDPTKSEIRQFLRSKGLKDTQLIGNARKANLREAFPNLSLVIMRIEKNDAES